MILNTLVLELGDCTMSILPKTDLKADFAQIQLFQAERNAFSPQIIYFCKWSDFANTKVLPNINVVIWDDRPFREEDDLDFLDGFAGGLVFPNHEEYLACFDCFERCYLTAYQLDEQMTSISDTVYNNGNLQHLSNQIANLFHYPINIVDNSFTVISSSDNFEFFSEDLARDNQSGFIPPRVIKDLNIAAQRRRNSQSKTIVINHVGGQFQNYFTPIVFNDIALGYFSVFLPPAENLSPLLKQYLSKVATILGVYMQRSDFSRSSRSNYYTTLLSSLLSENSSLNDVKEERFQTFGYKMLPYKYIFVVDIAQENPEDYVLGDLSNAFKRIFGNCIYTIQHNQIIYLASYATLAYEMDSIVEQCENQLVSTPYVHIGVGSPFTVLAEARGHLLEARAAIDTAIMFHARNHVFFYDHYRLMHMVQTLGQHTDIRMFSLPQLKQLQEYDTHHNTDLLYTLYVYTQCIGDVSHVCKQLHIHRNTLYFRINKIIELTNLDPHNADQNAMILISFNIMRMQNEISWS